MKIKKQYKLMEILDSFVLIDTSNVNSNIIKLNETSKEIVQQLLTGKSKKEIIDYMLDTYNVEKDVINKDFDILIDTLKKANVIDD